MRKGGSEPPDSKTRGFLLPSGTELQWTRKEMRGVPRRIHDTGISIS
jgi:hypothetical protein